jgi:hypothetical protein
VTLTDAQRQRVERDLASGILELHRPKTDATTAPGFALSARTVCSWCCVAWPCSQAEWAQERRAVPYTEPKLPIPVSPAWETGPTGYESPWPSSAAQPYEHG